MGTLLLALALGACDKHPRSPTDPDAELPEVENETGTLTAEVFRYRVPLSGALVRLYLPGNSFPRSESTTGASGQASFSGLAPGTYDLLVIPPYGYEGGGRRSAQVHANETVFVEFEVGEVVAEPTSGTILIQVVDPDSVGLPAFRLSLSRADGGAAPREALTDDTGWARFDLVTFGTYYIDVEPPAGYVMACPCHPADEYVSTSPNGPVRRILHAQWVGQSEATRKP